MRLERVRPCDGQCCIDQPQFPEFEGGPCRYFDEGKCRAMANLTALEPDHAEQFIRVCRFYPQAIFKHAIYERRGCAGRGTLNCCLQWVS